MFEDLETELDLEEEGVDLGLLLEELLAELFELFLVELDVFEDHLYLLLLEDVEFTVLAEF